MAHPENEQKAESRMNWMAVLVIFTIASLTLYFIAAYLMHAIDEGRKTDSVALEQQQTGGESAPAAATGGTETQTAAAEAAPADGAAVYNRVCVACHQAEGSGVPGAFPPLVGSEYVTGDATRLAKIILHGLAGPVTVKGEKYNSAMPAWGGTLNDAEVAAVATHIRKSWGNSAGEVTTQQVAEVRKATASRNKPYSADELK